MMSSIIRVICQKIQPRSGFLRPNRRLTTASVRAEADLPRAAPWLMLPPTFSAGDKMVYNFYSPTKGEVVSFKNRGGVEEVELMQDDLSKLVGSSHGWLALFNWRNRELFLLNPLSGRRINLPPAVDCPLNGCPSQVILSCSPDNDEEECRALKIEPPALFCKNGTTPIRPTKTQPLSFCYPGRSKDWTLIGDHHMTYECVYSSTRKRFFFMLASLDNLECWNVEAAGSPRLDWKETAFDWRDLCRYETEIWKAYKNKSDHADYLVFAEHSDQLYMVRRYIALNMGPDGFPAKIREVDDIEIYPYATIDFCVCRINSRGGGGDGDDDESCSCYMDGSLDGLVMFVGINHSFALLASDFPELKPDSIYFTDDKLFAQPNWRTEFKYSGHDVAIFDYKNKTFSSCYYPHSIAAFRRILPTPLWFTPTAS